MDINRVITNAENAIFFLFVILLLIRNNGSTIKTNPPLYIFGIPRSIEGFVSGNKCDRYSKAELYHSRFSGFVKSDANVKPIALYIGIIVNAASPPAISENIAKF